MRISKHIIAAGLLLLVVVFTHGCSTHQDESSVPEEARQVFQKHMSAAMSQRQQDPREYAYYEGADRFLAADQGGFVTTGYIVDKWTILTEDLWQVDFQNLQFGEEAFSPMTHYVGKVNGEFRVMLSVRNIPETLREAAGLLVDSYERFADFTPKAVFAFHEEYLDACADGFTQAVVNRYMYFANDANRDSFFAQEGKMEQAELVVSKRLGYDLWAVFYYASVTGQPDRLWTVDFVGIIDNQLKVMPNATDIPEDIRISIEFQILQAYDIGTIKPDY